MLPRPRSAHPWHIPPSSALNRFAHTGASLHPLRPKPLRARGRIPLPTALASRIRAVLTKPPPPYVPHGDARHRFRRLCARDRAGRRFHRNRPTATPSLRTSGASLHPRPETASHTRAPVLRLGSCVLRPCPAPPRPRFAPLAHPFTYRLRPKPFCACGRGVVLSAHCSRNGHILRFHRGQGVSTSMCCNTHTTDKLENGGGWRSIEKLDKMLNVSFSARIRDDDRKQDRKNL